MFSKFLFALVVFCFVATAGAFEAYQGSARLGLYNIIKCGNDLKCEKDNDKLKISYAGGLRGQIASTTASLTAAQCGSTIVSDSADVMTLPEASTVLGCRFTFVCGVGSNLDVNPADATDVIGNVSVITGTNTTVVLTPVAGDAIRCGAVGASVQIEANGANLWSVIGVANGVWTDVN